MRLEVVIVKKKRVLKFIIIFLFLCCVIGYASYKGYKKYEDNKYSEADLLLYMELIKQHFYQDGIINCPYIEDNNIVDNLLLIPKTIINI